MKREGEVKVDSDCVDGLFAPEKFAAKNLS